MRRRTRGVLFFWIVSGLAAISARAAPVPPGPVPGGVEPEANLRLFLNQNDLSYYAEVSAASETDNRKFRAVTLGPYYQPLENLKLGVFYRRAYGLRHDEDWVSNNGIWDWQNTNGRGEDFLILDATPKASLPFLPGENWVGELKTRFIQNFYNHEETFLARPGVTYFWLKDDQPFMNFFLQWELDFPLNYGVRTLYEEWIYLGTLYHVSQAFDLGAYGALKWETWGSTQSFVNLGGTPYAITTQTYVLGLFGVFHFDL